MIKYPPVLLEIAETILAENGKAILVGGCVRDSFLKMESKDFDIEVFGIANLYLLKNILSRFGSVSTVGKSFGVIKLKIDQYKNKVDKPFEVDFSFPRKDFKINAGHKGFETRFDPDMSYAEAASRRDFTINSIGYDLSSNTIIDPFDGQKDIKNKILRHINHSFIEDPLRVLRAMQLSSRLNFRIAPETINLCRKVNISELPKERIFEEFKKLLLKSEKPSTGIKYAYLLGITDMFQSLKDLANIPQSILERSECNLWDHTLMTLDRMSEYKTGNEKKDIILMLAALCHNMGKEMKIEYITEFYKRCGYDKYGLMPVKLFLSKLTNEKYIIKEVLMLIKYSYKPFQLYFNTNNQDKYDSILRKLSMKLPIEDLIKLARASCHGSDMSGSDDETASEIEEQITGRMKVLNLTTKSIKPILTGAHLKKTGIKAGPVMGRLLKEAFARQLDGKITTIQEALKWVEEQSI